MANIREHLQRLNELIKALGEEEGKRFRVERG
jgi:hypothetical protein